MKELTKEWIAEKLKELMKKKSLDKIRITELCALAEIDRTTFYYHFRDKADLVAWIFYEDAFQTNILDVRDAAESLKRTKENYIFFKRAFEDFSQNPLWRYMQEYYSGRYMELAKARLGTDTLDEQIIFSIRMYSYGTIAMSQDWILSNSAVPAEREAAMMFASMPELLKEIFAPTAQQPGA